MSGRKCLRLFTYFVAMHEKDVRRKFGAMMVTVQVVLFLMFRR